MRKFTFLIGMLFLLQLVAAAADYTYTTRWTDAAGNAVTDIRTLNFICQDSRCDNPLGNRISDRVTSDNTVITTYAVPATQYGYATYYYAQCFVDQELTFKPSRSGDSSANTQFNKMNNCKAEVVEFIAPTNQTANQTVNITARVQSPLRELDHLPAGEPDDPDIAAQFYSADTTITLTVTDAAGNVVFTDNTQRKLLRDSVRSFSFDWFPTTPGIYTLTIHTTVPDCKCDSQIERTQSRTITIIAPPHLNLSPHVSILTPRNGMNTTNGTVLNFTGSGTDTEDGMLIGNSLRWSSSIDGPLGTGESIIHTLSVGTHTITLTGTDSDGATDTAQITLTIIAGPPDIPATANFQVFTNGTNTTNGTIFGIEPISAFFSCTGTGDAPLSYHLDFGDGLSIDAQNAGHVYLQQGTFIASCTVRDVNGETATSTQRIVVQDSTPIAAFFPTPNPQIEDAAVQFTDLSTGYDQPLSYAWDFGDLTGSAVQNPSHTYANPGTYLVRLTVTDFDSSIAIAQQDVVILANGTNQTNTTNRPPVPVINLPLNGDSFVQGTRITFSGSAADPEDGMLSGPSLIWTSDINGVFGIGNTFDSNALLLGVHTITLTATDSDGLSASTSIQFSVIPPNQTNTTDTIPQVNFTTNTTNGTEPLLVEFRCSATGDLPVFTFLDFGDGEATPLQQIVHTYRQDGAYTAICIAIDSDGDRSTQSTLITVEDSAPNAAFTIIPTVPNVGQDVSFIDLSTAYDQPLSYAWLFGDGGDSSISNPVHQYLNPGIYTVQLTVMDNDGSGDTAFRDIIVNGTPRTNNTPPNATILRPADGSVFIQGAAVIFEGIGRDREEGVVAGSNLAWRSDVDGLLGTGDLIGTTTLSLGRHTITLTATDLLGATGSASIQIFVNVTNNNTNQTNDTIAPVVELISPIDLTVLNDDDVVLSYRATDMIDDFLDCTLYTDRTGTFVPDQTDIAQSGVIEDFAVFNLADGTYRWNVQCRDDANNSAFAPADFRFTINTTNQTNRTACDDGLDNDGDTFTDFPNDLGCTSLADTSELNAAVACDDGLDNDGDGQIDYPDDIGCISNTDTSEYGTNQCDDGVDNDADGFIDFPADADCGSRAGTNESGATTQCNDGIDNDGDTFIDFPADTGCTSAADTNELGTAACDDGIDNDADGFIDFPDDVGCTSSTDTDEQTPINPPGEFMISIYAAPTNGEESLAVNFGVNVFGGDAPYTYRWSFGDGTSSTLQTLAHTYTDSGRYTATVTVTDASGASRTQQQLIVVDGDATSTQESLHIRSIRINNQIDPQVLTGDDLDIDVEVQSLSGLLPDRLSLQAALIDSTGVISMNTDAKINPFRRGKTTAFHLSLSTGVDLEPGTYDLRLTLMTDDGRFRTKHRDVHIV